LTQGIVNKMILKKNLLDSILKHRKRARNKKGEFVKDDPNTLWNEAYTWNIFQLCKDNWVWIVLIVILLSLATVLV